MNGILLVNKQENMTSRDVVNEVCKIFNTKKVGHTGTLDPMAKGVLVLALGTSLKIVNNITCLDKEYITKITLGIKTDTLDNTGKIISKEKINNIDVKQIDKVLNSFLGDYHMQVPLYSAVKVNGKKLYEYARNNIKVELPYKDVKIYEIERISDLIYENDKISFKFKCKVSKGTYIRSLINDIAKKLNTIGIMSELTRIKQGKFSIEDCYTLEDIKNGKYKLLNMKDVIDLPIIKITDDVYKKVKNGMKLENNYNYEEFCFEYNDNIIAIYKQEDNYVKPVRVFNTEI
jgi:tRNA pseudouridine55 synthase